jgi:hypothetical protein
LWRRLTRSWWVSVPSGYQLHIKAIEIFVLGTRAPQNTNRGALAKQRTVRPTVEAPSAEQKRGLLT